MLVLTLASAFSASLAAALALTPVVMRLSTARGLVDPPVGGRRIHTRAVPRLGGVAVAVAALVGLLAATAAGELRGAGADSLLSGVFVGGGMLLIVGVVDDVWGVRPRVKLAAQLVAAVAAFHYGLRIDALSWGGAHTLHLGALALPVTIVWIAGVSNAFNLIDGLDGLAPGLAVVALATLLAVCLALGQGMVAVVCAVFLGAVLGFLPYNFNPARIFLGDCGSLMLGFLLAVLSVHGAVKSATAILALVPLLVLALPLIDTALAILRRLLRGVPVSSADRRHIHHRLLDLGFTTRRVALLLYAVATLFGAMALLLVFAPPHSVVLITAAGSGLSLGIVVFGIRELDYHEFMTLGTVVARAPAKVHKVLKDRIHAGDLAPVLRIAGSLEEINAALGDAADVFSFGHIEVCSSASPGSWRLAQAMWGVELWKLDYPVSRLDPATGDGFVLRIWCGGSKQHRPYGAERVAGILGPVLREWFDAHLGIELSFEQRPASPEPQAAWAEAAG